MKTDNLILLDIAIFDEAFNGARNKFPETEKSVASDTIFYVLQKKNEGDHRMAYVLASEYLKSLNIYQNKRQGVQSTVTRYFIKKANLRKARRKIQPLPRWDEILELCIKERPSLDRATNEDVIDPDGVDQDYLLPCTG